jgi:hypothetical protein
MIRHVTFAALACLLVATSACSTRPGGENTEKVAATQGADTSDAGDAQWLSVQSLIGMEQAVATTCSGALAATPMAATNAEVEQALTGTGPSDASTQVLGPMTRPLSAAAVCGTKLGSPQTAAGIAVGLDAVVMASSSANGCELAYSSVASQDAGGRQIPLPGGRTYPIAPLDWRDILRVIYAGVDHNGNRDCNSPIRQALASNWNNLFEWPPCGNQCAGLKHAFRPGDLDDSVDIFLQLLDLPPISGGAYYPFCNAGNSPPPLSPGDADFLDNDPIRTPCSGQQTTAVDVDHVCEAGNGVDGGPPPIGDLGLVLPIVVPQPQLPAGTTNPTPVLYPSVACTPGSFANVNEPSGVPCIVSGPPGQCVLPYAGTNNFACHNDVSNVPPGANLDGRAFNLQVRQADGSLAVDQRGRPLVGAFYRMRAGDADGGGDGTATDAGARPVPCQQLTSEGQSWCLSQNVKCTLAAARRSTGVLALPVYPAGANLTGYAAVSGVPPSDASLRSGFYPLAYKVYVNTVTGFQNVPRALERLGVCWARKSLASSAGQQAGLVGLANGPACRDFNEQALCDASTNVNACANDGGEGWSFAFPACSIDVSKELFITNPAVVDADAGALTIKTLFENLAPTPDQAPAMMRDLLMNQFVDIVTDMEAGPSGTGDPEGGTCAQSIGGAQQNTASIVGLADLVRSWPTLDGTDGGPLDLTKAPFRLLAIVNRIDLAQLSDGGAGQGRFIFALTDGGAGVFPANNGGGPDFTFILEYALPGQTLQQWATAWHQLASLDDPDSGDAGKYGPEYLAGLQQLTQGFTARGLVPSAPNGSALISLRTRDPATFQRQFALTSQPSFISTRIANTPYFGLRDPDPNDPCYGEGADLLQWVSDNQSAVRASRYILPYRFLDLYADPNNAFFTLPGFSDNELRHTFSMNTCSGCHSGETPALVFQVAPRMSGAESALSPFLTGQGNVLVAGDRVGYSPAAPTRHFNDLERRASYLRDLVCP